MRQAGIVPLLEAGSALYLFNERFSSDDVTGTATICHFNCEVVIVCVTNGSPQKSRRATKRAGAGFFCAPKDLALLILNAQPIQVIVKVKSRHVGLRDWSV